MLRIIPPFKNSKNTAQGTPLPKFNDTVKKIFKYSKMSVSEPNKILAKRQIFNDAKNKAKSLNSDKIRPKDLKEIFRHSSKQKTLKPYQIENISKYILKGGEILTSKTITPPNAQGSSGTTKIMSRKEIMAERIRKRKLLEERTKQITIERNELCALENQKKPLGAAQSEKKEELSEKKPVTERFKTETFVGRNNTNTKSGDKEKSSKSPAPKVQAKILNRPRPAMSFTEYNRLYKEPPPKKEMFGDEPLKNKTENSGLSKQPDYILSEIPEETLDSQDIAEKIALAGQAYEEDSAESIDSTESTDATDDNFDNKDSEFGGATKEKSDSKDSKLGGVTKENDSFGLDDWTNT